MRATHGALVETVKGFEAVKGQVDAFTTADASPELLALQQKTHSVFAQLNRVCNSSGFNTEASERSAALWRSIHEGTMPEELMRSILALHGGFR